MNIEKKEWFENILKKDDKDFEDYLNLFDRYFIKINKVDKNKITKMEFHKNFIRVFYKKVFWFEDRITFNYNDIIFQIQKEITSINLINKKCNFKFYEKIENDEIVYFYIVDDIEYKSNVKINLYLELYEKFLKDRISIFM